MTLFRPKSAVFCLKIIFFVDILHFFATFIDGTTNRQRFRVFHDAGQALGRVPGPFLDPKLVPKSDFHVE